MKFRIRHEMKGRVRVHFEQNRMSCKEAEQLLYYLQGFSQVTQVKVYERTADAAISYTGSRDELVLALRQFRYQLVQVPDGAAEHSGRELNAEY